MQLFPFRYLEFVLLHPLVPAVLFAKLEADKIAEAVFRFEDVTKATMDKQSDTGTRKQETSRRQ